MLIFISGGYDFRRIYDNRAQSFQLANGVCDVWQCGLTAAEQMACVVARSSTGIRSC